MIKNLIMSQMHVGIIIDTLLHGLETPAVLALGVTSLLCSMLVSLQSVHNATHLYSYFICFKII